MQRLGIAAGLLLTVVAYLPSPAGAQTIRTTVGTGTPDFCGDGGSATSACLRDAWGVVFDAAGNLFIGDYHNHRIRKVTPAGTITTVAGNGTAGFCGDDGPAVDACLHYPSIVVPDSLGNLYIADAFNHRIRKVNPAGIITTVAGTGFGSYCGDGDLATNACLFQPQGVALDAVGNLFIADAENHRIRKVDTAGTITTVAGTGTESYCGDDGPAMSACLAFPLGVTVDAEGSLFIADYRNQRIRRVSNAGTITTVAGNGVNEFCGDDGPATSACLRGPTAVAIDLTGSLFIADTHNNRIRKVVLGGAMTTVAGNGTNGFCGDNGPAASACLAQPSGVAFDAAGSLFIGEYGNHRVRRVSGLTSLTLSKSTISGCLNTTGKVTLSVPAPSGGQVVTLGSDNTHVGLPASVTVKAGARTKTFAITTDSVASVEQATLTATVGPFTRPASLTLKPMVPKFVLLEPNPVVGGNVVAGTVTLECAAGPGDIEVTLSSSRPTVATPTIPSVTVFHGATTAPFAVSTSVVTAIKKTAIRATANGVTKSKTLIVNP